MISVYQRTCADSWFFWLLQRAPRMLWNACKSENMMSGIILTLLFTIIFIIITRPNPAYGRQGLAGMWGQDTDEVSTFLVFLTSHFPLATLSSDLTNQGPLMTMKIHLETLKKHGNQPKTMKNHETTLKNHGNQPKTIQNNLEKP